MERKKQLIELCRTITDNTETAEKFAEHLSELIYAIDPDKISEDYILAIKNNDYSVACKALAEYYRKKPRNTISKLSSNAPFDRTAADRTLEGYAREVNVDWKFENGEVDFLFNPTEIKGPCNHEWLWQFNRHGYWANLARTYIGTREEKYALGFEKQLLKWIAQTDIPASWNAPGSAWRTIECGIRLLGCWQITFDGFVRSEKINDITLLLMIASMLRQTVHLINHPTRANWLVMEMNGVYTFSALFTEIKAAEQYRRIASEHLLREISTQILPDGMHNELSPDYQGVVFGCAADFYSIVSEFGMKKEIPDKFVSLVKSTVNAAVKLSTPAFTQPRTNDCFTIPTKNFTRRAEQVFGKHPVWSFVNTERREGAPPEGETASVFLNYAGFAVMRNDWSENSAYLCFDIGPLGVAHMHQDKLNINIWKGDEELIYDDGGGQYEISAARNYAISGYGHNTVLVDGLAQNRSRPTQSEEPIDISWTTNSDFDYAAAVYDGPFGNERVTPASHHRAVKFCKPDFFCVTDTLKSSDGENHSYEVLFHLDTTKVKLLTEYKNGIISDFEKKYDIAVIPLDSESCEPVLKTVSAQTDPVQGWYNGRNEASLHEAITVSREVNGVKDYRFTTLFFPLERGGKLPEIERISEERFKILFNNKEYILDINKLCQ